MQSNTHYSVEGGRQNATISWNKAATKQCLKSRTGIRNAQIKEFFFFFLKGEQSIRLICSPPHLYDIIFGPVLRYNSVLAIIQAGHSHSETTVYEEMGIRGKVFVQDAF